MRIELHNLTVEQMLSARELAWLEKLRDLETSTT